MTLKYMYEVGDFKLQRCQAIDFERLRARPWLTWNAQQTLILFSGEKKKSFFIFHISYAFGCSMSQKLLHSKNISFYWVAREEYSALCCPRAAVMGSTRRGLQRRLFVLSMIQFTARRRYPHLHTQMIIPCCFWKILLCRHICVYQCSVFQFILWGMIRIESVKVVWTLKNARGARLISIDAKTPPPSLTVRSSCLNWSGHQMMAMPQKTFPTKKKYTYSIWSVHEKWRHLLFTAGDRVQCSLLFQAIALRTTDGPSYN